MFSYLLLLTYFLCRAFPDLQIVEPGLTKLAEKSKKLFQT